MRKLLPVCVGSLVILFFAACNDDGNNGGGGDGLTGVYFTQQNAAEMVGPVASFVDFLPGLSQAINAVIAKIDALSAPALPAGIIDLGDLGMCTTGQATATWSDADDSGDLSAGDVLSVQVTNCDGEVSGTLTMAVLTSGTDSGSGDLDLSLTIKDEVGGVTQTLAVSGKFRLEVEGSQGGMAYRYLVPQNTDGSLGVKAILNGTTAYEMGCFNFYFTFQQDGTYTLSEPVANVRIPGEGILSMSEWGAEPMAFTGDSVPVSGQLSFWAEAFSLPCARLDIPAGGVDANDSKCVLTATGGGNMTLEGQTADGQPFTVHTTWDDIR